MITRFYVGDAASSRLRYVLEMDPDNSIDSTNNTIEHLIVLTEME